MIRWVLLMMLCTTLPVLPAMAVNNPDILTQAGFDPRLSQSVPVDLSFRNAQGQSVHLEQLLTRGPGILVLAYYRCPNLCGLVLEGLAESLKSLSLQAGQAFRVIVVSIDPRETPADARAKKAQLAARFPAAPMDTGWYFLTGQKNAIEQLAASVGFRYSFDPQLDQYAHAAGITLLSSEGRITQYFHGVRFPARTLRLGLVEAADGAIGSPLDQALLLCYDYDPVTGRYSPTIMKVLRLIGVITLLIIVTFMATMLWREKRHGRSAEKLEPGRESRS